MEKLLVKAATACTPAAELQNKFCCETLPNSHAPLPLLQCCSLPFDICLDSRRDVDATAPW